MNKFCSIFLTLIVLSIFIPARAQQQIESELDVRARIPLKVGIVAANETSADYVQEVVLEWYDSHLFSSILYPYQDENPVDVVLVLSVSNTWYLTDSTGFTIPNSQLDGNDKRNPKKGTLAQIRKDAGSITKMADVGRKPAGGVSAQELLTEVQDKAQHKGYAIAGIQHAEAAFFKPVNAIAKKTQTAEKNSLPTQEGIETITVRGDLYKNPDIRYNVQNKLTIEFGETDIEDGKLPHNLLAKGQLSDNDLPPAMEKARLLLLIKTAAKLSEEIHSKQQMLLEKFSR